MLLAGIPKRLSLLQLQLESLHHISIAREQNPRECGVNGFRVSQEPHHGREDEVSGVSAGSGGGRQIIWEESAARRQSYWFSTPQLPLRLLSR